ncbi:MAG TPA: hypothetical protein VHB27_16505 [Rhodopila sp.]|uniref:hypothetical protein n=1 Tax=Rhodopila sp. TaxID=2480087 RepID=UPI002CEBB44B|nr:hypothetical protein [Rhodopila sp.]HVY16825.1 hypothetical protein [Rhodopila sp.]
MRRETITMIWVGGAVLAVLLYVIGPDQFLNACARFFDALDAAFRHLAFILGAQAYNVARALAIAFYVVFGILAFLSAQRGRGGIGGLIVMTIVLLLLVWRPYSDPAPISHWIVALALVLVGAATMTQRLTAVPRRPPPFPPNGTSGGAPNGTSGGAP